MCIKDFVNRLSHNCHLLDIDRDVSTVYCWSSSDDGVDPLSRTICTMVVVIYIQSFVIFTKKRHRSELMTLSHINKRVTQT